MIGRGAACAAAATLLLFAGAQAQEFVTVAPGGNSFKTTTCEDFALALYQSWEAVEAGAGVCCGGPDALTTEFTTAAQAGLNTVRFNAFATQDGQNLQTAPGEYDENLLTGLDTAIARAGDAGLRVILTLATNWDYTSNSSDTKSYYSNQSATAKNPDSFWTDGNAEQAYLGHVRFITTRKNSVNNLVYSEDPTILGWDLINEGRCESEGCTPAQIQAWTAKIAPTVKALVPNQLLTIGQEGFWQADNCASNTTNPVANTDGWPLRTGQDYLANHAVDGIDFASIHLLPVNWARVDNDFGTAWLNGHAKQASIIKKPLVVEVFSTQVGVNNFTEKNATDYYKLVYAISEASINTDGAIRGIGFALWDGVRLSAPDAPGVDPTSIIPTTGGAWTDTIVPYAGRIATRCPGTADTPGAAPLAATPSAAESSRRRLLQAPAAGPRSAASSATSINAQVPADFCAADTTVYAAPSLAPSTQADLAPVAAAPQP